ncbi:hypothetical protein [Carboxylicivirga caseinilyticus]|uniref:hypothetical protein n=1 Tax=Carboxylicivirga caseinilyticus TaxID=3417572 RepID=UPI003D356DB6|nr:hypothetical protein [Marinilabiliaceae bacterium A049]
MDDFGDILYVLVMLGALVFSVIRKAQQAKKNVPRPGSESSNPYDPLDEEEPLMEEIREMFSKPKVPKPQPVFEKPKTEIKPFAKNVAKPIVKRSIEPLEVINTEEEHDPFIFDVEEVDMRKAVIYSEILNRPYQ